MKKHKKHPLNQSPFYKLSNHKLLAKILGTELSTIKGILKRGDANYKFGTAPGNSDREIQVPKSQLCRIHNRIANLLSRIETPDYLTSGVKGRSHVFNARLHFGSKAVAKADIKKFYISTSSDIVKKDLKKKFKMSDDLAETLTRLTTVKGFVPTGSSLSQSLAYFVNASVFDHLDIYSRSRGLKFSLYVDDLTFSGKVIPKYFLHYVIGYIKKCRGYTIHKIRNYKATSEKVVTGVVLKNSLIRVKNTHRNTISKMMKKVPYYFDPVRYQYPDTIRFFQRYLGHLFSAGEINPRYRQIGKIITRRRKALGIKGENQHLKAV